jgi:adenylyltransferase/sulfurtransferase
MVLNYKNGPTLRCIFPEAPHPLEVPSCEEFGVIGSIPGIIGSLQATEVIKIILDMDGVLSGKLFMIDTANFNTWISSFEKNPDLPVIKELGEYEDSSLCDTGSVKEISAKELKKMLSKDPEITVIDLRDKDDNEDIGFKMIQVPYYDVSKKIKLFSEKESVVFYCRSGSRSTTVINYLQKVHKLENLFNLVI